VKVFDLPGEILCTSLQAAGVLSHQYRFFRASDPPPANHQVHAFRLCASPCEGCGTRHAVGFVVRPGQTPARCLAVCILTSGLSRGVRRTAKSWASNEACAHLVQLPQALLSWALPRPFPSFFSLPCFHAAVSPWRLFQSPRRNPPMTADNLLFPPLGLTSGVQWLPRHRPAVSPRRSTTSPAKSSGYAPLAIVSGIQCANWRGFWRRSTTLRRSTANKSFRHAKRLRPRIG